MFASTRRVFSPLTAIQRQSHSCDAASLRHPQDVTLLREYPTQPHLRPKPHIPGGNEYSGRQVQVHCTKCRFNDSEHAKQFLYTVQNKVSNRKLGSSRAVPNPLNLACLFQGEYASYMHSHAAGACHDRTQIIYTWDLNGTSLANVTCIFRYPLSAWESRDLRPGRCAGRVLGSRTPQKDPSTMTASCHHRYLWQLAHGPQRSQQSEQGAS